MARHVADHAYCSYELWLGAGWVLKALDALGRKPIRTPENLLLKFQFDRHSCVCVSQRTLHNFALHETDWIVHIVATSAECMSCSGAQQHITLA